ncbi:hypothetical protein ACJIZ3_017245 [Penstemon smallii]|uniref:Formin-like protein n=1 Tax=Penstemon smallii TaxID=265156 RepID=A0ABD3SVD6_9LAMI
MLYLHLPTFSLLFTTFFLLLQGGTTTNRRLLHQPFFLVNQPLPPTPTPSISQPPTPSPQPQPSQPKYPFSSTPTTTQNQFFPFYPSPPPPPTTTTTTTTTDTTFPANISSLVLPSSSTHSSHKTIKLISLILIPSLISFLLLASLLFLLLLRHRHRHRHHDKTDTLHLFPPNITPSHTTTTTTTTTNKKPPPQPTLPNHTPSSTSSEFLYLGTLISSRDTQKDENAPPTISLGSPELHPLPPLPRQHSHQTYQNSPPLKEDDHQEEEEEEFYSPRGSTENFASPYLTKSSPPVNTKFVKNRSLNSSNSSSPSVVLYSSIPRSIESGSPESLSDFPAPLPRFIIHPPPVREQRAFSSFSPSWTEDYSPRASDFSASGKVPPQPPPPPPAPAERLWEAPPRGGPPELVAPAMKVVNAGKGSLGNLDEIGKPKLKPLHWDKVRASSDRAMVWDQLKSSSFQLNEEMIQTLFTVNSSNMNGKDGVRRQIIPDMNHENQVLDPKRSQNIAILLRALNVTIEEVCEALTEGNADTLGTELLESLLRMAPTKEEERKLKEFKDDSPFKLGTAETFLKAMLDIPFAFKRVDAMLYIANFESEIEYLKRSFCTLELACKELKSSRMFLKLLEAVLSTGNRMNVGTNRGDAHAFKLDSLLKLVDIKGTDKKTTLLHFVVQEIIRAEGARLSSNDQNPIAEKSQQPTLQDEVEFRKIGLQVVSGLSRDLTNVKKAAAMDADGLSNDVSKLANGITKITDILKLNKKTNNTKFCEFMNEFLKKAELVIMDVQAQEGIALSMLEELTVYFYGDSAIEEARGVRIFVVVRDFLGILDQVCKDVGKTNERTMVNLGRQIETPTNLIVPQVFPGFNGREKYSSSDDERPSSS